MRRHASLTWIMRSHWTLLVLLIFVSSVAGQPAYDADEPIPLEGEEAGAQRGKEKAHVGFGGVTADGEILNIIRDHQAMLHAVHMWSGGFSGTYRSYEPTDPAQLLQEARQDSIAHFARSLEGNDVRLQTFAENYRDAEVAQNPELLHQLRSLLGIRARIHNTLAALRSGSPVIYSVEVEADSHYLEEMAKDPRISAFNRSTLVGGKAVLQRTPKPTAYENFPPDAQLARMGTQEVLAELAAIRKGLSRR
jgi:hypothetical protein